MIPTLFEANYIPPKDGAYRNYPPHGTVDLTDAIECFAVQVCDDDSVEWEVEMLYPSSGIGFGELAIDKILVVKANSYQSHLQGFRIYSIQKKTDKTVTVKAQHISYDLANVPVKPFKIEETKDSSPHSAAYKAVAKLRDGSDLENGILNCEFYITTDFDADNRAHKETTDNDEFIFKDPKSMRAVLLDGEESIRGNYGGDLVMDNYVIKLMRSGGEDRGVSIVYGIDLIDLDQERNNSEMITGILPYYRKSASDDKKLDTLTYGDITPSNQSRYNVQKIVPVDLTSYFPDNKDPSKSDVTKMAQKWVSKNRKKEHIGVPELSIKVSYAYLKQNVRMFDAIKVEFPKLGVNTSGKVVKYKYNVLLERCEEIELDHAKSSKYFSLMDANKLRKGFVPPDRIGKGSIRGGGGGHIQKKSVTGDDMEDNTIHHNQLANKEKNGEAPIQTGNIAQYAIEPDLIATNALNSTTVPRIIKPYSIKGGENGQLTLNGVHEGNIANESVSTLKLKGQAADAVTYVIQHYPV